MRAASQVHLSPAPQTPAAIPTGLCPCTPRLTHSTVLEPLDMCQRSALPPAALPESPPASPEQPFATRLNVWVFFKGDKGQEGVRKLPKPISIRC